MEYSEAPAPITGGFDTLTYGLRLRATSEELCSPLILRVFRADHPSVALAPAERARFESAVQNSIAHLGFPAPRVIHTCTDPEIIGAPFVIMERLPGRIMLDFFFRPSISWPRLPRLLAEAHARLHSLDPRPLELAARELSTRRDIISVWPTRSVNRIVRKSIAICAFFDGRGLSGAMNDAMASRTATAFWIA